MSPQEANVHSTLHKLSQTCGRILEIGLEIADLVTMPQAQFSYSCLPGVPTLLVKIILQG